MGALIRAIGTYVPERRMSNDDLARIVDTSDEWIYSHTGIRYRHIASEAEAASDLAVAAIASLQDAKGAGVDASSVDLILLATSTPDHPGLPSTASIVQNRIAARNAGAMDIVAACSGFVYALETARAFVESGAAQSVLVVGSEVYSRILNWEDRRSCVLFGDGAGAVLVSRAASDGSEEGRGLHSALLASDGSGAECLMREAGGSRKPLQPGVTTNAELMLSMDGRKVYYFAVQAIIDTITALLEQNDLSFEDIDWVVPHQANVRIIDAACKRAGWDRSRFFMNIEHYANTSAASIPIALADLQAQGSLEPGSRIITVGFGGGLSYGGNYLVW